MRAPDGRPDHIEDYLVKLHENQWFGWSDSKNKVYANLILHSEIWDSSTNKIISNQHTKP